MDEVDESPVPFYDVYVNSQAIRLTWEPDTMKEMAEEEVVLMLWKKSEPRTLKAEHVLISDGEVTLNGLAPATLYTMTVIVTQKGQPDWRFSQDIETPSTGKREHSSRLHLVA
ncbi:unnamed protein product [Hydatigera taeniaeformis]|uniref:Fibronectin type-III domain-containing protein n=1 Tax=Hydatigena taeniaeformis TaxID=6205 RepID=A0A0R3WK29_HYDTA|nr:unnamed protein product [Hydatigera taeniaeformis]